MWLVCRQGCYPACSSFLPPPPPSMQQEAPLSSLPAGQRGGQRGHRGAWCCLMAVRTGRARLQMWCQLLPGVTLEGPMAACPPPSHPPCAPPSVQLAPCLIRRGGPYMPFTYCYCVFVGENKHLNQTFTRGTTYTEVCVIVSVVFKYQRTEKLTADNLWTSCLREGWFLTSVCIKQTRCCCKRGGETFGNDGKGLDGSIMKHRGKERNRRMKERENM